MLAGLTAVSPCDHRQSQLRGLGLQLCMDNASNPYVSLDHVGLLVRPPEQPWNGRCDYMLHRELGRPVDFDSCLNELCPAAGS